jgi:hypothetical protein
LEGLGSGLVLAIKLFGSVTVCGPKKVSLNVKELPLLVASNCTFAPVKKRFTGAVARVSVTPRLFAVDSLLNSWRAVLKTVGQDPVRLCPGKTDSW